MKSSLEIAQQHQLRPIVDVASDLGLSEDELEPYGRYKAKIALEAIDRREAAPNAKIICVAGVNPTAAGEGKTTTAVGLTQGLGVIGRKPVLCLREASLGPVFGVKGGAAGGGFAQVVPMEDLNLHFTGDIHAVGAANNLLAAMIDASLLHGNPCNLDSLRVGWRRAIDINDRALRQMVIGLGGPANGFPRESGFDITAASEVMGILAVARDLRDLRARLGRITVGYTSGSGDPVTAEDLEAAGSMTVLLKDAIKPNLVQTLEGQPCLIHAGPFANIAHGNSSLIADLLGQKLGDYVVTESGFGSDMGMEKFIDIVCRNGNIAPSAIVLVTTVRALVHHGGGSDGGSAEQAIRDGAANLVRHLEIVAGFGLPCVVAVNQRPGDTDEELQLVRQLALDAGAFAAEISDGFAQGGNGAVSLAEAVVAASEQPSEINYTYPDDAPIADKISAIATKIYGARRAVFEPAAQSAIERFTKHGLGTLPICVAKTPASLSSDPNLLGAPRDFDLPVRDVRAYTGAGWLVPLCGDIRQMPGLGANAAAKQVDITEDGTIVGLF